MALLKSLFRRPLTHSDLLREAERLISNPPLPQDLKASVVGLVGRSGVNLLDYWRDYFRLQLKTISGEETWALQKAKLLKLVMIELDWRAVHTVAQDAKSINSWSHLIEDIEWIKDKPKEQWESVLLQKWIMAILSDACLRVVGMRAYALDKKKEVELDMYYQYSKEIKSLDVGMLELINEAVRECHGDDARAISGIKNEAVNPIIREQYRVLALLGEDVANGSVDVVSLKARIDALDEKKAQLAKQLQSGGRLEPLEAQGKNEKLAAASELGRLSVENANADLEAYIRARFYPTIPDLVEKAVFGELNTPDAPPLVAARADLKSFADHIDEYLRPTVVPDLRKAVAKWLDVFNEAGVGADFEDLIEHKFEIFKSSVVLAALEKFLGLTDTLKAADEKWRVANPEKAAEIGVDTFGPELANSLAPYLKRLTG